MMTHSLTGIDIDSPLLSGSTASSGGQDWKTFILLEHAFPEKGFFGLAVKSHNPDQTVDAAFSQLILSNPKD